MGQLISIHAMKKAIEKAKTTGVGIVSVRNSNHFGIAGYYAKMACDEGLMGMACTNSEAIMVPTFGRKAMLGSIRSQLLCLLIRIRFSLTAPQRL